MNRKRAGRPAPGGYSMKKLLVADIDGTLAHDDHVPEVVADACHALVERGWDMVLATGRILGSAKKHIIRTGASSITIVYDGARVMDAATGREIWGQKLDPRVVKDVLEMLWDIPWGIQVFRDENVLCKKGDDLAAEYFSKIGVPVDEGLLFPEPIEGVYRVILYGDPGEVESAGQRVGASRLAGECRAVMAGNGFLDILPSGVSKGAALQKMISLMQESERPSIVAAAGDHLNDLEMLRFADIAITMDDARASLREVAHIVLPPASAGGFAHILEPLEEILSESVSEGSGRK